MLTVKNISKNFGNTVAVDDISFQLEKGEIVGLLGANGAGKSTTLKILTGVIAPDKGNVNIAGADILQNPLSVKRQIGYLSEDNPLPNEMYVREYLEYVVDLYNLKDRKQKVAQSIEAFGLQTEYKKKIQTLSKGNRQKLGLAQAIIHDPEILILDEPTTALDPGQQLEIKEMILKLAEQKVILFSTHILQEVANIASRIIIINKGKIVSDKRIEEIESVEDLFHTIVK